MINGHYDDYYYYCHKDIDSYEWFFSLYLTETLVEKVKKAISEDQPFNRIFAVIHIGMCLDTFILAKSFVLGHFSFTLDVPLNSFFKAA